MKRMLESGPWHGGAVHSPAVRVCTVRPHCPGQCSAHRPADRAGAAVSRRTHRRRGDRQRRFQHHTVGHWQRIGGAGSPDRERPAHQPVLGLSFGIGYANRRPSDPWAGSLLALLSGQEVLPIQRGCRAENSVCRVRLRNMARSILNFLSGSPSPSPWAR